MKAKALQFGKAMSAALFVLLLVVAGSRNALAQNLVATLQHGDSISMYYGGNALSQAHSAAQTGDIITLSSGYFTGCTITKAITLRGAGCYMDTITGIGPTVLTGTTIADVSDEEQALTIEGIWMKCFNYEHLINPRFIKCNFTTFSIRTQGSQMQNAQFVNCMVDLSSAGLAYSNNIVNSNNTQFINCYVSLYPSGLVSGTNVSFMNSIVSFNNTGTVEAMAANCIFYYASGNSYITFDGSPSLFHNCVSIHMSGLFNSQTSTTNLAVNSFSDVFETYNGYSIDFNNPISERFILKSDFATSFLGNDGTEVGIHGGQAPYNPRPNYMVLKQCNVATQSTIDNKLSVEIQVVSEGE